MSDRGQDSYLQIDSDPADELLGALRSALGQLGVRDLSDRLLEVLVEVWQTEACRDVVSKALEEL